MTDKNRDGEETTGSATQQPRSFEKTPMFVATNSARYHRQALIKEIEASQPKLLCYVAGDEAPVNRRDILYFVDMLFNFPAGEPLDLMLHTPGGDVDAADKIITLIRNATTEQSQLRVIVPDFAKSSGTLMALGANRILMSDSSELGPIDPQWPLTDSNGNRMLHSVLNYLNAYADARKELDSNPNSAANIATFEKFDPTVALKFEKIKKRTQDMAENLLKRRGANYTRITKELMDGLQKQTHGQMINWEEARMIGLPVTYLPLSDPVWRQYWSLYCHLRSALTSSDQRIFESYYVSLTI